MKKNGLIEYSNGTKAWYKEDNLHREDGPAIEYTNGDNRWFLNGKQLSEEEFNIRMDKCMVPSTYGIDALVSEWNAGKRKVTERIESQLFTEICGAIGGILRLLLLDCTNNANVCTGRIFLISEPHFEVFPDAGSPADTRYSAESDGLIRVYGEEIAEHVSARCGVSEDFALSMWKFVTSRLVDAPNVLPELDVESTDIDSIIIRAK